MKTLRFKRKYFEMICSGKKSLECRVNYPSVRGIKEGEFVSYFWEKLHYDVKIVAIRRYNSFYKMLKNEDINKLVPGMNFKQALNEYRCIYPDWKVKKFDGVVVFESVPSQQLR